MISAPGITVNGVKITIEQINAEVQYHPAANLQEAKYAAMRALIIRELLLQQAANLGICKDAAVEDADGTIGQLLDREIIVPIPSEDECRRYYKNNERSFISAPLFEVSHILYPAPPNDERARAAAREKAERGLRNILDNPQAFQDIARAESACPSGKLGGNLGQIGKGQTVPAFEAALMRMQEGELSQEPVATEVGFHIIHVRRRVDGKPLPFEAVANWIHDFLKQQSWQRAFSQYIQILAAQADISGFRLKQADSPLVQ